MLGSGAMRRLATAVALAALLALSAMPARGAGSREGDAYGASVSAIDNVFTPEIVRIDPGQTVEWTMDGRSPHTVQADDGSWDSGNLEPGAEFAHAFEDAGVYPFFCRYHGGPGSGDGRHGGRRRRTAARRRRAGARSGPARTRGYRPGPAGRPDDPGSRRPRAARRARPDRPRASTARPWSSPPRT